MYNRIISIIVAVFVSFFITSCDDGGHKDVNVSPRLVLLYATCTVNTKYLSPYNKNITFTPHLQQFADESFVFMKHRTEAGQSGVAFASIYSGNQAINHSIFGHPNRLPDSVYTIGEAFFDNGYEVFSWNAHGMANADLNYVQGVPEGNIYKGALTADDEKFKVILERLRTDKNYKAMIMTNFTATHAPYDKNNLEGFCKKYSDKCSILQNTHQKFNELVDVYEKNRLALTLNFPDTAKRLKLTPEDIEYLSESLDLVYRSTINHLDSLFGAVVEKVGKADLSKESLIVFTADHGESLYRDTAPFKWSHGHTLQADVLNVPLIIRAPGQKVIPGKSNFVSRSIDVFPTIAGLAGIKLKQGVNIEGIDLSLVLQKKAIVPELLAYSHSAKIPSFYDKESDSDIGLLHRYYPKDSVEFAWVAVMDKDIVWKYRRTLDGEWEYSAYDLKIDPTEQKNIYDPDNALHRNMAEKLKIYKANLVATDKKWHEIKSGTIPEKTQIQKLKSLGYIK